MFSKIFLLHICIYTLNIYLHKTIETIKIKDYSIQLIITTQF